MTVSDTKSFLWARPNGSRRELIGSLFFKVPSALYFTVSTSYTTPDAAVNLSRIFPSSSFRNRTSPASTRDGLAFEGDYASADALDETKVWITWQISE